MYYNNFKLYFGVFDCKEPFDLNETGVSGGIELTKDNLALHLPFYVDNEFLIDSIAYSSLDCWEEITKIKQYELWVWLGHSNYVLFAKRINAEDILLLPVTDEKETPKVRTPRYTTNKKSRRAFHYKRSSKLKNTAKVLFTIEDYKEDYPQLAHKATRTRVFLNEVATEWDSGGSKGGNGWKDNSKRRHQWRDSK